MYYINWYLIDICFCYSMLLVSSDNYKYKSINRLLLTYLLISIIPIFNIIMIAKIITKDILQIKKLNK